MSKINSFGKSDVGLRRSNNEDAFVTDPELGYASVADGMGGQAAGEVASRIFIETVTDVFSNARPGSEEEYLQLVQDAFRLSNERIIRAAAENPSQRGMGCTAEVAVFFTGGYVVGHVGDSRTYLFRSGELRQITLDHSLVQEQVDQGLITAAEARTHSLRHVILRAVGTKEELAVDLIRGKTMPGDIFLLCSDGLTDMVEDGPIRDALSIPEGLEQKVDRLIRLALSAGGYDNITAVLCEIV
ncbi:MAG: Stp1/IreP family PP2C-type Ser/Thr phosphatase [Deferribacteres bacterium]|nr:Stp1/IreP family PP2C-type Ser/Thr phosphatase [Deferribacteres bacterium]